LAALYRTAAAAVFTTVYEGFHIPPLDAAAAGCPVVATDIPVHREILGDGPLYAPVGDADAVAAAVRGLIDDPDEARRRGDRLWARAAGFSWDASAARLVENLRKAVAGRPGRA
jgi:glycosyltransferase involved in cell wall biosynthesis